MSIRWSISSKDVEQSFGCLRRFPCQENDFRRFFQPYRIMRIAL